MALAVLWSHHGSCAYVINVESAVAAEAVAGEIEASSTADVDAPTSRAHPVDFGTGRRVELRNGHNVVVPERPDSATRVVAAVDVLATPGHGFLKPIPAQSRAIVEVAHDDLRGHGRAGRVDVELQSRRDAALLTRRTIHAANDPLQLSASSGLFAFGRSTP